MKTYLRLFFTLVIAAWSNYCFALLCPSVTEIKYGQYDGWKVLNERSEPATSEEIVNFKQSAAYFYEALWAKFSDPEPLYNEGSCFYQTADLKMTDVWLKKSGINADLTSTNWKSSTGFLYNCFSIDVNACLFTYGRK